MRKNDSRKQSRAKSLRHTAPPFGLSGRRIIFIMSAMSSARFSATFCLGAEYFFRLCFIFMIPLSSSFSWSRASLNIFTMPFV